MFTVKIICYGCGIQQDTATRFLTLAQATEHAYRSRHAHGGHARLEREHTGYSARYGHTLPDDDDGPCRGPIRIAVFQQR